MTRTAASSKTRDPFAELEAEHRAVEDLFERLRSAKSGAARSTTFLKIKAALGRHATLEEHIVYPALRCTQVAVTQEAATEGFDEHEQIKALLAQIEATDPETDAFVASCLVLEALVAHHVKDEEEEMFPAGRKHIGAARLAGLAARLASTRAAQESAPPDPTDPNVPPRK